MHVITQGVQSDSEATGLVVDIDPGIAGCLAVLDGAGRYVAHLPMPTIKAARSRSVQLFSRLPDLDTKARGQSLADALLIGLFGLKKFNYGGHLYGSNCNAMARGKRHHSN